jgi:hypothetical protein
MINKIEATAPMTCTPVRLTQDLIDALEKISKQDESLHGACVAHVIPQSYRGLFNKSHQIKIILHCARLRLCLSLPTSFEMSQTNISRPMS